MAKSKWEQVKNKLTLIEGWARDGLTDEQIYKNLGIGKTTFYKLVKEHSELSEHLKKGKEIIDYEVEKTLLEKALGGKKTLKKQKVLKDGKKIEYTEDIYVTPDITAIIFWLKNRKPEKWRDKVEVENKENKETLEKLDEVLKGLGGVV